MKYFSMFSGIGGFELGIERSFCLAMAEQKERSGKRSDYAGVEGIGRNGHSEKAVCIGFSEIDRHAISIYQKHFPTHKNYGDARRIVPEELPDFDMLCGGFPCQAFSIAGKRGGFNDTRGTLFFEIARIAKAKEPMFMLLENVKGLVSHDQGKTLETILETLQCLGYYVNYEIRNSKDYGVPQNRERIFFLCKHIKLLDSAGQSEKMSSSEGIIQEWLFQILLNNLKEAKKAQGAESKDWVLGYLICLEISQNQSLLGENILDGILIATDGESSLFRGDPWQNIDTWLRRMSEGCSQEPNTFTTSTALKQIIESRTYTFSKMFQAILLATALLRASSSRLWKEILSNLTLIQEGTKYARINNENEEAIITEYGTAHIKSELQDNAVNFIIGHLGGASSRQVFPIGEDGKKSNDPIGGGGLEVQTAQCLNARMHKMGRDDNYIATK